MMFDVLTTKTAAVCPQWSKRNSKSLQTCFKFNLYFWLFTYVNNNKWSEKNKLQPICQSTMRFIKTIMPKTLNRKHEPNMLNMMSSLKIHQIVIKKRKREMEKNLLKTKIHCQTPTINQTSSVHCLLLRYLQHYHYHPHTHTHKVNHLTSITKTM